ncbi:hypothetical protein WKH57_01085 [Niallia taxi]|uniref:hypothetical protein n=1 Tax=Niallia taxi TaxID=2499688 RepID=UPI00317BD97E
MDILEKLQKKIIESDWAEKFKESEEKDKKENKQEKNNKNKLIKCIDLIIKINYNKRVEEILSTN